MFFHPSPSTNRESSASSAIFISSLNSGGAERVVSHVLNGREKQGKHTSLITLAPAEDDHYPVPKTTRRIVLGLYAPSGNPLRALTYNFRRIVALRKILKKERPENLISFHIEGNVIAILAGMGLPTRIIISERNDPDRPHKSRIWNFLRNRLYKYADLLTANSRVNAEKLKRFAPENKIAFLPNPVVPPKRIPPVIERSYEFLHVGRHVPDKCLNILLKAFADITGDIPQWKLRLVGHGPLTEALKSYAQRLEIPPARIIWQGNVPDPAIFYKSVAVFVLPSRFEGMPNALLEAMSWHLPSIITDATPGPMELITHNENGLIIPAENPNALSSAMKQLAGDMDLRAQMAVEQEKHLTPYRFEDALASWNSILS